jgi:hypothetical protein
MEENRVETKTNYQNVEIPGVKISVYGETESTKEDGKCGKTAVEKIVGDQPSPYGPLNQVFESFGYMNGVTFQHNTYDFRVNAYENHSIDQGRLGLKIMKAFTGKRSLVFGHSYGNNVAMVLLKNMSQSEKDELVREYVAVGPPFLGSLQALYTILGNAGFMFMPSVQQKIGIEWLSKYFDGVNPKYARQIFPKFDGMYEFLSIHSQIPPLLSAVKENQSAILETGVAEPLLDSLIKDLDLAVSQNVLTKRYRDSDPKTDFKLEDLPEILEKFALSPYVKEYFDKFDFSSVSCDKNPGVATRVIYLSELPTQSFLKFKEDPNKALDDYRFPDVEIDSSVGDETVNLFSLIGPPMKWLTEYLSYKPDLENVKRLDDGTTSKDKVIPKKITFVEFGFKENVESSDTYKYIQCKEHPSPKVSKKSEHIITDEDLKNVSWFQYAVNKGLDLLSVFKSFLKNPFSNNSNKHTNFVGYTFMGDDTPKTCNHAMLVTNPGFFKHLAGVILTPDEVESQGNVVEANQPDELFDEYVIDCPVNRCKFGLFKCWEMFKDKFSYK